MLAAGDIKWETYRKAWNEAGEEFRTASMPSPAEVDVQGSFSARVLEGLFDASDGRVAEEQLKEQRESRRLLELILAATSEGGTFTP